MTAAPRWTALVEVVAVLGAIGAWLPAVVAFPYTVHLPAIAYYTATYTPPGHGPPIDLPLRRDLVNYALEGSAYFALPTAMLALQWITLIGRARACRLRRRRRA